MGYFSSIDLFVLDFEIFLIWILKKIFYIKFNYWRVYFYELIKYQGQSEQKLSPLDQ